MPPTTAPPFNRTAWRSAALVTLLLGLSSCGPESIPETPLTPPLTPPADAPTALVHGMTGSPVYNALESKVKMTVSDGSQKAADYSLLIVDGDTHTPEALRDDPLVQEAIRAGTWVLGLDHDEDHKQVGLGHLLEAGTKGSSPAYLTRKTRNAAGHPTSHMIEFQHEGPDAAETRAEEIVRYLTAPELTAQQTTTPPTDLLHVTYVFTENCSVPMPGIKTVSDPPGQPQTASWTVSHAVKVFLENDSVPQGDYQWVLVETTGSGNPGSLAVNKADEIGWYQTQFDHSFGFVDASSKQIPGLSLLKSQPENADNVSTVTTNVEFGIGFSKDGPSANFGYSNTTTKEIADWKVRNYSESGYAGFVYGSNNPTDGFNGESSEASGKSGLDIDASAFSDCTLCSYLPVQPNTLSTSNMEYFTQALYQSDKVIDDTVTLEVLQAAGWTDAWCFDFAAGQDADCYENLFGDSHTRISRSAYFPAGPPPLLSRYSVDLGAVVPIPIKGLTFSPNPVVAGQNTTGTLTLEKPAETDVYVTITSQSEFATPTQNIYTVPKGEDHVDFTVETAQDGTGKNFGAVIRAFYAEGQNAELQITQPTSGN